ncbi:hypothetical protein EC533_07700 [Helicobacter pylori]|uniref:hypothetical protein n=1 Tax=Helicobacter pylori TaxID=210 RepID=UPI000FDDADB4|nr:hypothetical protein [Helicobacter pylori]RVZ19300.1 hypothetical protein EC533_07700 [Helicobacter pylori]
MQKMYQNENLFTMRLILPQIYWISKKVLGCFNLFIFKALIFVTIKLSFEFYKQYLMRIEF